MLVALGFVVTRLDWRSPWGWPFMATLLIDQLSGDLFDARYFVVFAARARAQRLWPNANSAARRSARRKPRATTVAVGLAYPTEGKTALELIHRLATP